MFTAYWSVLLQIVAFSISLQVSSGKLQCAEDWTYSDHTGNCYRFFNKDTRWPTAEVMCVIRGGHNIAVHDLKDNEYIQQIVLASGKKTLWLGAAQFGSSKDYVWSDHSKFDFEHWQGGKHPEYNHARRCTKMDALSGKWFQSCCKVKAPFICMKKPTVLSDNDI